MMVALRHALAGVTLVAGVLSQAGCCSLMSGTTQPVVVASTPAGATVRVNGAPRGTTPVTILLNRDSSHAIHIEKDGYEPYATALSRRMNGWVFGNILTGGLIGLVVDVVCGTCYTITPDNVPAKLSPKQGATPLPAQPAQLSVPASPASAITARLQQLQALKEGGLLTEEEYNAKKTRLLMGQ